MKNSKISKILVAALSSALLLTAAFGITALADDATPVIVSKNISYEGALHLYYAIPKTTLVTAENTTLSIYDADPSTEGANLINTYTGKVETIEKLGGEYIVIRTGGIAAKDMAKYVYAQAESAGNKSEVVRYSVYEYLNERLYVDTHTAVQENLYTSTLQYGISAQAALTNYPTQKETPIDELCYVYVNPDFGTVDGKNYSGIYTKDTVISLDLPEAQKPAGGYGITTIKDGEHKKLSATTLKIKDSTIISNFVFDGETFENINHPFAVNTAAGAVTLNGQNRVSSWLAYKADVSDNGFGITSDPDNPDNKVLGFRKNSSDNPKTNLTAQLYINSETVDSDFNAVVFEADLRFDRFEGYNDYINLIFMDNASGDANYSSQIQKLIFGVHDGKMTLRNVGNGAVDTDLAVNYGEWFNLRVEYYILDADSGITRTAIYVNDKLFQLSNYTSSATVPTDINRLAVSGTSEAFFDMYMDNLAFRKVKRDFEQPVIDFEDGKLPSGIRPSTWGGATDNTIENYVENGEFVVKTESANRTQILFSPTEKYASFGSETINTWVFEADVTISGSGAAIPFYFNDGTNKYGIMIGGIKTDSTTYMWFENADKSGTYSGSVSGSNSVQNGVTHHLRFEYYLTDTGMAIKLIADGVEKVTITKTTTSGIPSIESMYNCYFDTTDQKQVADFTFDNVQFYNAYIER